MDIVFCADRRVLPGLHVAAYSLLERISPAAGETRFTIFSEVLDEADISLLSRTLKATAKPFTLALQRVAASAFTGFPSLNGSWATYYRLQAAQQMPVERFLYVDADIVCDVDVSELELLDMGGAAVGWVPEAPLAGAVDRAVAEQLGHRPDGFYFNAGVLLVNVAEWRKQTVTERALAYIAAHRPAFHDQSALNYLLGGEALVLPERFNARSNARTHWPAFRAPFGKTGRLVHFVDYPKPWDWLGEWVHPQYRLWRTVLDRTAMKGFRSWHWNSPGKFPRTVKAWIGYKKTLKDSLLFAGYAGGWLKNVKWVPKG
jgi:lipopolysaccharide biosynthesis glycosyltransferase